jgi:hypothetical protein
MEVNLKCQRKSVIEINQLSVDKDLVIEDLKNLGFTLEEIQKLPESLWMTEELLWRNAEAVIEIEEEECQDIKWEDNESFTVTDYEVIDWLLTDGGLDSYTIEFEWEREEISEEDIYNLIRDSRDMYQDDWSLEFYGPIEIID